MLIVVASIVVIAIVVAFAIAIVVALRGFQGCHRDRFVRTVAPSVDSSALGPIGFHKELAQGSRSFH